MRSTWTFEYTNAEIRAAVHVKIDENLKQAEWWGKERDKAEALAKAREDQQGGGEIAALVRGDKCRDHIDEHTKKVDEFMRWKMVLGRLPEDTALVLDIDDVEHFGL